MRLLREMRDPPRGASPRSGGRGPLRTACALIAAALGACADTDANQVTPPVVLGMTATLAAAYDDGEMKLYQVQLPVPFPVRKPDVAELEGRPPSDPYPRTPFVRASDTRIEVRYTISNLDDQPHTIELMLDPWNEFVRYKPGIVVGAEQSTPNLSGYDHLFKVAALSRLTGTLTNDDMHELAVDLATVQNIVAHPPADPTANVNGLMNRVFNIQNRSNVDDPLVTPLIPSLIAGLTGFDLGLRTTEAATIAVEILMDLTDLNGNRITPAGTAAQSIGVPAKVISPPGARLLN